MNIKYINIYTVYIVMVWNNSLKNMEKVLSYIFLLFLLLSLSIKNIKTIKFNFTLCISYIKMSDTVHGYVYKLRQFKSIVCNLTLQLLYAHICGYKSALKFICGSYMSKIDLSIFNTLTAIYCMYLVPKNALTRLPQKGLQSTVHRYEPRGCLLSLVNFILQETIN